MLGGKIEVINKRAPTRNHMKMQRSALFVKKNLKINMLKIKNIVELGTTVIMQVNVEKLQIAYLFSLMYRNKLL